MSSSAPPPSSLSSHPLIGALVWLFGSTKDVSSPSTLPASSSSSSSSAPPPVPASDPRDPRAPLRGGDNVSPLSAGSAGGGFYTDAGGRRIRSDYFSASRAMQQQGGGGPVVGGVVRGSNKMLFPKDPNHPFNNDLGDADVLDGDADDDSYSGSDYSDSYSDSYSESSEDSSSSYSYSDDDAPITLKNCSRRSDPDLFTTAATASTAAAIPAGGSQASSLDSGESSSAASAGPTAGGGDRRRRRRHRPKKGGDDKGESELGNTAQGSDEGAVRNERQLSDAASASRDDSWGGGARAGGAGQLQADNSGSSTDVLNLGFTRKLSSRRMSWSDESGQDLVKYFDPSLKREPSSSRLSDFVMASSGPSPQDPAAPDGSSGVAPGPPKSAMKRVSSILGGGGHHDGPTLSMCNQLANLGVPLSRDGDSEHLGPNGDSEAGDVVNSLPKNFSGPFSGTVSPFSKQYFTGSSAHSSSARPAPKSSHHPGGGNLSPQWGWYITTTPPVEMFAPGGLNAGGRPPPTAAPQFRAGMTASSSSSSKRGGAEGGHRRHKDKDRVRGAESKGSREEREQRRKERKAKKEAQQLQLQQLAAAATPAVEPPKPLELGLRLSGDLEVEKAPTPTPTVETTKKLDDKEADKSEATQP